MTLDPYFVSSEEQVLQELQTKVVECGDTSTTDNICTEDFTLEKVNHGKVKSQKSTGSRENKRRETTEAGAQTAMSSLTSLSVPHRTHLSKFTKFVIPKKPAVCTDPHSTGVGSMVWLLLVTSFASLSMRCCDSSSLLANLGFLRFWFCKGPTDSQ